MKRWGECLVTVVHLFLQPRPALWLWGPRAALLLRASERQQEVSARRAENFVCLCLLVLPNVRTVSHWKTDNKHSLKEKTPVVLLAFLSHFPRTQGDGKEPIIHKGALCSQGNAFRLLSRERCFSCFLILDSYLLCFCRNHVLYGLSWKSIGFS